MSDFLESMAASSRERASQLTRRFTDDALDRPVFPLALEGFDLIAEIKNRSPAEGELSGGAGDRSARALRYADGGAAAISVLTEPDRFDGELAHLDEVVRAVADRRVPVMRKDFLTSPVQVLEARAAGASGVLLIAAMLDTGELVTMLDCAFEHGMFVLLESFDENDIEVSAKLLENERYREHADERRFLVGVNTRDLRTLEVDPERLKRLAPLLPGGAVTVAESGIRTAGDAADAAADGYRMALVGTALMRADDPAKLIADMLAAGRSS